MLDVDVRTVAQRPYHNVATQNVLDLQTIWTSMASVARQSSRTVLVSTAVPLLLGHVPMMTVKVLTIQMVTTPYVLPDLALDVRASLPAQRTLSVATIRTVKASTTKSTLAAPPALPALRWDVVASHFVVLIRFTTFPIWISAAQRLDVMG